MTTLTNILNLIPADQDLCIASRLFCSDGTTLETYGVTENSTKALELSSHSYKDAEVIGLHTYNDIIYILIETQTYKDDRNNYLAIEAAKEAKKAKKEARKYHPAGFIKTGNKMEVTFDGWDGKSYHGEGTNLSTWTHPNFAGDIFVKTAHYGGSFHKVTGTSNYSGLPSVRIVYSGEHIRKSVSGKYTAEPTWYI